MKKLKNVHVAWGKKVRIPIMVLSQYSACQKYYLDVIPVKEEAIISLQ